MKANSIASYMGAGMLALSATAGQALMVNAARADAPATRILVSGVHVSDLDLSKSSDVAALYGRIKGAAAQACGTDAITSDRKPSGSEKKCLAEAINIAVSQINNPSLSAYHKQESTKTPA
jgi:UrcA family protein